MAAAPRSTPCSAALAEVDIDAVVVIGEAGKGEAPQPARGERLGRPGSAFKADIAMDPVEGTSYLARGQTNALAVLAVAPRGTMMNPAPAFYMEKFVAPAPARGKIDPHWTTGTQAQRCSPRRSTRTSRSSPSTCWRSRATAS